MVRTRFLIILGTLLLPLPAAAQSAHCSGISPYSSCQGYTTQSECDLNRREGCTWQYGGYGGTESMGRYGGYGSTGGTQARCIGPGGTSCSATYESQCRSQGCYWQPGGFGASPSDTITGRYGGYGSTGGTQARCVGPGGTSCSATYESQCRSQGCTWQPGGFGGFPSDTITGRYNQGSRTPLVVELDGPVKFTSLSVAFDILGARGGFLPRIGWIEPSSGFLALDLNGNGRIDDGAELFGSGTILPNGSRALNGFAALAQYDRNGDGVIDRKDAIFPRLLVWRNAGRDGRSQPGELKPLSFYGIESLSLAYRQVAAVPTNGNAVVYASTFQARRAGRSVLGRLVDVFLKQEAESQATTRATHAEE